MNTQKIVLVYILTQLTNFALASISYKIDLEASAKYQEERHFKHNIECYWKKKASETNDFGQNTVKNTLKNTLNWNQQNIAAVNEPTYFPNFKLAYLEIKPTKTKNASSDHYSFTLNSVVSNTYTAQWKERDCNHSDVSVRPFNAKMNIEIDLKIDFQSKTWVSEISNFKRSGLFTSESTIVFPDAINAKYIIAEDKFYVWAKPGTQLSIKIKIDNLAFGTQKIGSLDFDIKSIGETQSSLKNFFANINDVVELMTDNTEDSFKTLSNVLFSILTKPDLIKDIPTKDLFETSSVLYELAHATDGDSKNLINAKTMAALLSYEMSMLLISELEPFCNDIEIESLFTGEKSKVLGLKAAHFWTSRAALRLEHFKYSALDALLNQMLKFERNKLTYEQVMNDDKLSDNLDKSYSLLTEYLDLSETPFTRAKKDISNLNKYFPSIGASESNTKELMKLLSEGSETEYVFLNNLQENFSKYAVSSKETVEISSIIEHKNKLDFLRNTIIEKMRTQIRFLSLDNNNSNDNFMAKLTESLLHQVSVFSQTSNIEIIENIRKNYLHSSDREILVNKMNKCIMGN